MTCPITPIDSNYATWPQPNPAFWDFDTVADHVIMPLAAFKMLARYDTTMPSGVYNGKMWKRNEGGTDLLVWYGRAPGKPDMCSINFRTILLKETVDLLKGESNV